MNEILKFKEGRKIFKAQHGLKSRRTSSKPIYGMAPHEILGGNINGELVAYVNIPGKGYLAVDRKGNAYRPVNESSVGSFDPGRSSFEKVNLTDYDRQHIYKAATRNGGMTSYGMAQASRVADYWAALGAPKPAAKPTAKPVAKPATAPAATPTAGTTTTLTGGGGVRSGATRRTPFVSRMGDLNLTDEEKNFITQAGFDPTNARSLQDFILSKASNANLGARGGAGKSDGYFGQKSFDAFQALRNQGIFTPKVDAQETPAPVVEQPVDAPDFGYSTTNHYDDGSELKGLGFNNYAGLQNFAMAQKDNQFARDLRQRFGDDASKWDQAAVEGALGVRGKYRGSSSGDFGDMARSMQQWAAQQNAAYDTRKANYNLMAEAAKTDPNVLRQLLMLKFMTGSNPGANTLGGQPGLVDKGQWAGVDGIA